MELSAFFQGDGAGAGDLAADGTVDEGGGGGNGIEELDAGSFFHTEVVAANFTDDFPVAADNKITRTLDGSGEFAEDGEVAALEGDAGDHASFLDDDITAGLDAAVPVLGDVVVHEADVAAAFWTLAGLRFAAGGVGVTAVEAGNGAWWFFRVKQPLEKGLRRWNLWLAMQ